MYKILKAEKLSENIFLMDVHQFMDNDIVDYPGRGHHQTEAEVQAIVRRAGSPASGGGVDFQTAGFQFQEVFVIGNPFA